MQTFEQLLDATIDFNKSQRTRPELLEFAKTMPAAAFAREFCTIHLDVGRQVGKTSYIRARLKTGDVVITPTVADAKRMFAHLGVAAFAAGEVNGQTYRGRSLSEVGTVYVDEPELIARTCPLHLIYTTFASGRIDQTFVLLGH